MPQGPSDYDASPYLPPRTGWKALRAAVAGCRGCPLYQDATQAVFGSGDTHARVMLVGEQPGDTEDRQGKPFVGPAGRLLDRALADAGIDPARTYVTNAVKHFKFETAAHGKRRIHKPPTLREISACRPWLTAELALTEPDVVIALGASAGKSLLGPSFKVATQRGTVQPLPAPGEETPAGETPGGGLLVATLHPSAVLRAGDDHQARYAGLVADLKTAAKLL